MISLGLTAAEQRRFHDVLASSHTVDIIVRVLDMAHQYVADVSGLLLDGQVNIDSDAEVTRNATLSLRDPANIVRLDTGAPADGALYVDRMIQIHYVVSDPNSMSSWSVPLFTGPITKMSRTVDVVNLECQGKEQLCKPPTVAWFTKSYGKGTKKTTIVRLIMQQLAGETRFTIPDWGSTTASTVTVPYNADIWATAKKIAGSRALVHLFYDGRGVCMLRRTPSAPVFTFRTGDGGTVVSAPQINYEMDRVRNAVRVTGATPKATKTKKNPKPVTAVVAAPRSHPLSTYSLGRNGGQRIMLEEVSDDGMKTTAQCVSLGRARLADLLLEAVDVSFDARVIPHLEPEDIYVLSTPDVSLTARVKRLTIPLRSGPMAVGYNVKRAVNKQRIRRK